MTEVSIVKAAIVAELERQTDLPHGDHLGYFEYPQYGTDPSRAIIDGQVDIDALAKAISAALNPEM